MNGTLSIVIVGVGKWKRYTLPLLQSLDKHMHAFGVHVTVVDNGTSYPDYPTADIVRTDEVVSYAAGLNYGLYHAPVADWYLILNNDILIRKPFSVDRLDTGKLYGFITYPFRHWQYLAGWAMFIPYQCYVDVGDFDENLAPMWFEDADYCIRAQKAGYKLATLDRKKFGIKHFESENMKERKAYMQRNMTSRRLNRQYVERKHNLV